MSDARRAGFAKGKTTEKAPQTPKNKVDKTVTVLSMVCKSVSVNLHKRTLIKKVIFGV